MISRPMDDSSGLFVWTWRVCLALAQVVLLMRISPLGYDGTWSTPLLAAQLVPLALATGILLLAPPVRTFRLPGILALALVTFCALSTAWSVDPTRSTIHSVVLALGFAFVHLSVTRRWDTIARIRGDLAWVLLLCVATIGLGVVLRLVGLPSTVGVAGRLQGLMANPNYLGMLTALSLTLVAWLYAEGACSLRVRRLLLISAGGLLIVLLWSGSRGALLGLVAALAVGGVLWLLRGRPALSWYRHLGLVLAGAVPIVLAWILAVQVEPPAATDSAGATGSLDDVLTRDELAGSEGVTTGRLEIWQTAVEVASERPVLGAGFRTSDQLLPDGLTAHNLWLSYFLEIGLVGTGIALALLLSLALPTLRTMRATLVAPAVVIAVQGMVEASLQSMSGPASLFQWITLFAMAAVAIPVVAAAPSPSDRAASPQ